MAGVENDSETTAKQEATVSMETIDELNPPKPRPPSPEYDDPDRKDVHEDNSHLFRVSAFMENSSLYSMPAFLVYVSLSIRFVHIFI